MSFALPEAMRAYIHARLRNLIEEGLASGPGLSRSKTDNEELLAIARGNVD